MNLQKFIVYNPNKNDFEKKFNLKFNDLIKLPIQTWDASVHYLLKDNLNFKVYSWHSHDNEWYVLPLRYQQQLLNKIV